MTLRNPRKVLLHWQPDSAWQAVKAEFGERTEADRPFVGQHGGLMFWGAHPECLHHPKEARDA